MHSVLAHTCAHRCRFGSHALGEPASVAHSAMLMLALAADTRPPGAGERLRLLRGLAAGVLHQQRQGGTYQIHFGGKHSPRDPDAGWQLYAGEAMLAVLAAHRALRDARLLHSVRRALPAYERLYR